MLEPDKINFLSAESTEGNPASRTEIPFLPLQFQHFCDFSVHETLAVVSSLQNINKCFREGLTQACVHINFKGEVGYDSRGTFWQRTHPASLSQCKKRNSCVFIVQWMLTPSTERFILHRIQHEFVRCDGFGKRHLVAVL